MKTYNLKPRNYNLSRGYVALITMLVIGSIGLTISISLLLLSTSSARTSFALEQSSQARALASACAQEALQRIRMNREFIGTRDLEIGRGNCVYNIIDTGGETREIQITATIDIIVSKMKVDISSVSPKIIINSWQEVGDF